MKTLISILFFILPMYYTSNAQVNKEQIQAIIQKEVNSKRAKSIIVGVIDSNGRQIINSGILSEKDHRQPDGNTIYEIGSITKVFAGLLLAEMSLKHEVNLDDSISKFLPPYVKTPSTNGKQITLRHLATHRAGFPRNPHNMDPKNFDNPFADYTPELLYEYISNFQPVREINSKYQYSNTGFNLLGYSLTLATGKNFENLVKEKIGKPLGMTRTIVSLTPELRKNMAYPHLPNGRIGTEWEIALGAGGALRSSTNDLLTFAAANLGFVKSSLAPAIELSHQKQAKKEGKDFMAMGWTVYNGDGEHILWKDGSTGGYCTFIGIDKINKRAVVVLSNSNNTVTDIGKHILNPKSPIMPYEYKWTVYDTVYSTVKTKGVEKAIELYQELKSQNKPGYTFDENQLMYLGNELRRTNKIKEAIKIYLYNLQQYPTSVTTYENLAETYKRSGNTELALQTFEKLASMDENIRWTWMINRIKSQ